MNILQAIEDTNLFGPFLGNLKSWENWFAALRVLYGLPLRKGDRAAIRECTGRDPTKMPKRGFDTALFLTGRRSGKSRTAALIGAYEAVLAGHESKLAKGERGIVLICAPTKSQSRIVRDYLRSIFDTPILQNEVASESKEGFELNNGNRIEILAGDWKTVRGFTLIAAIIDEAAFFGYGDDSKIKSDTELVRASKPSLATVGGKLIAISTPYAPKGWCYNQHKRNFGNEQGKTLVWNCPSRTMNPTLKQSLVDDALAEDLAAAKAEYLGEFRDDVANFLPREVIERLVVPGRKELMSGRQHIAFCDISGGRGDDAALAIAHKRDRTVVIDLVERHRPPFNPYEICRKMAETCRRYGVHRIVGDWYGAEFVARAFQACDIRYQRSEKNKSDLYLELLPRLCSGEIELLDNDVLVNQLAGLERRIRSGGKDKIDHGPNQHDDLANAVAGVAVVALKPRNVAGIIGYDGDSDDPTYRSMAARLSWLRGIHPGNGAKLS